VSYEPTPNDFSCRSSWKPERIRRHGRGHEASVPPDLLDRTERRPLLRKPASLPAGHSRRTDITGIAEKNSDGSWNGSISRHCFWLDGHYSAGDTARGEKRHAHLRRAGSEYFVLQTWGTWSSLTMRAALARNPSVSDLTGLERLRSLEDDPNARMVIEDEQRTNNPTRALMIPQTL